MLRRVGIICAAPCNSSGVPRPTFNPSGPVAGCGSSASTRLSQPEVMLVSSAVAQLQQVLRFEMATGAVGPGHGMDGEQLPRLVHGGHIRIIRAEP